MSAQTITHTRLQELMVRYDLTPNRLSGMAGLARNLLRSFYDRPDGHMRADSLQKLASVLHCSVEYLQGTSDVIEYVDPSRFRKSNRTPLGDGSENLPSTLVRQISSPETYSGPPQVSVKIVGKTAYIDLKAKLSYEAVMKILDIVHADQPTSALGDFTA